jgi:hypothetical protein
MAPLRIPAEYKPGLRVAASLSAEQVERVAAIIRKRAVASNTQELARAIAPVFGGDSDARATQLSIALFSLYALMAKEDSPVDRVARDVAIAFLGENDGAESGDKAVLGRLEQNLRTLLASESLWAQVKAVQLKYDHERTYCDAKIYTDIRPIFAEDAQQAPSQAVLTHTLKLTFHQGTPITREVFFMLDDDDLEDLSRVLERARAKSATLQKWLGSAGIVYVRGPDGGEDA